jgi:uroporphyrinogen III methyltransferase / synthase
VSKGIVYLVGAGPGDPGLITVRGAKLLERAEVVVYDYLSTPRLLSYAPQAEHIYVGKKAASHTLTQEQINALIVEKGLAGKRVVRLKGGDPFVFGRGGEECEALRAAGIPFEVVPGITSAIGGSAYAGIPVTHRDFNSSFTLITGHEKEEDYKAADAKARGSAAGSSDLDWSVIAKLPCVAFYMGVKALPRIIENLIANGKDPATPAACIQWGTTSRQRTATATIATLVKAIDEAKISSPAITIIGKVVTLRPTMNWFESRPLFGQSIIVTRTRQQASDLSDKLEQLGADVIEAPTIEIYPAADQSAVDAALRSIASYDWVVFTSQNGVAHTKQRLLSLGLDTRAFAHSKIAAIGDATARALADEFGLRADLCPKEFVAEALADAFNVAGEIRGKKFLLLRADIARSLLRERLEREGAAKVSDIAIYETRPAAALPEGMAEAIREGKISWITFTSSSTAKNFVSLLGRDYRDLLKNIKLASIGPITTATLRELGLTPAVEAESFNVDGLVNTIRGSAGTPRA